MENNLFFTHAFVTDLSEAFEYINSCYSEQIYAKQTMRMIEADILRLNNGATGYHPCPSPFDMLGYRYFITFGLVIVFWVDKFFKKAYLMRCFYGNNMCVQFFDASI